MKNIMILLITLIVFLPTNEAKAQPGKYEIQSAEAKSRVLAKRLSNENEVWKSNKTYLGAVRAELNRFRKAIDKVKAIVPAIDVAYLEKEYKLYETQINAGAVELGMDKVITSGSGGAGGRTVPYQKGSYYGPAKNDISNFNATERDRNGPLFGNLGEDEFCLWLSKMGDGSISKMKKYLEDIKRKDKSLIVTYFQERIDFHQKRYNECVVEAKAAEVESDEVKFDVGGTCGLDGTYFCSKLYFMNTEKSENSQMKVIRAEVKGICAGTNEFSIEYLTTKNGKTDLISRKNGYSKTAKYWLPWEDLPGWYKGANAPVPKYLFVLENKDILQLSYDQTQMMILSKSKDRVENFNREEILKNPMFEKLNKKQKEAKESGIAKAEIPKPISREPNMEAKMLTRLKSNLGSKGKGYAAFFVDADWEVEYHKISGAPLTRKRMACRVYEITSDGETKCVYSRANAFQKYMGTEWSNIAFESDYGHATVLCSKVQEFLKVYNK